jgi:cytochrome oxidase Cu insertion factor (SCO1/SenC/PrrC family)
VSQIIRKAGVCLALCLIASVGPAQDESPENPREAVRRQFLASGLEVGSQFPDIQIHDAEGKPFRTGDLRGNYSVLVTGCLT